MTIKQPLLLPVLLGVILLATVFSFVSFCAQGQDGASPSPKKQPLNQRLTAAAWAAFNAKNYNEAISQADQCIELFQGSADLLQTSLAERRVTLLSGSVTDPKQRAQILSNGLLNDVATCFFIKGYAAERLKQYDEAKNAYEAVETYPLARTWNQDDDTFWVPSEGAAGRLVTLKKKANAVHPATPGNS